MRRLFPILAVASVMSLLTSLVAGLLAPLTALPPFWLVGFVTIVGTHALAGIFLESTGNRVETLALSGGLPDWVSAQAEKNRRKAIIYLILGLPLFPVVTLLKTRGLVGEAWSLGLLAFNLAFQVGAFIAESVIMSTQAQLVRDVEEWALKSSQRAAGRG